MSYGSVFRLFVAEVRTDASINEIMRLILCLRFFITRSTCYITHESEARGMCIFSDPDESCWDRGLHNPTDKQNPRRQKC
jgi:hypothetical protein